MLLAAGAETAWHSREVERIAVRIADRLGLSGQKRQDVGVAARLHDIGKVALPPKLLQKPTAPNAAEWKLIRNHTVIGERILRSVEDLRDVAPWVRHSHERWDGRGYPDGLSGGQIPEVSRIVFCADAFHAICTDRPYSEGRSMAAALAEMRRCAGTQFEPRVVAALTDVVRHEMYGPISARRRSHARLSLLMVIAVTLCGSIAGGIAASRNAASPPEAIRDVAPLATPAASAPAAGPTAATDAPRLAPRIVPRGGVAGEVTGSEPSEPDDGGAAQAPSPRSEPAQQPTRPSSPLDRLGDPGSITRPAEELGSRLGITAASEQGQPADDSRQVQQAARAEDPQQSPAAVAEALSSLTGS